MAAYILYVKIVCLLRYTGTLGRQTISPVVEDKWPGSDLIHWPRAKYSPGWESHPVCCIKEFLPSPTGVFGYYYTQLWQLPWFYTLYSHVLLVRCIFPLSFEYSLVRKQNINIGTGSIDVTLSSIYLEKLWPWEPLNINCKGFIVL